jgi:hypothetical protein
MAYKTTNRAHQLSFPLLNNLVLFPSFTPSTHTHSILADLSVLLLCNTSTKRLQDFNPIHTTPKVCQHAAALSVAAAEAVEDVVASAAAATVVVVAADSGSVAVVTLVAAVAVAVVMIAAVVDMKVAAAVAVVAVVMIAAVVDMKVAAAVAVVAVVMIAVVAAVEAIRICLSAADPPDLLPLQEATVGHQPFHLEFTC